MQQPNNRKTYASFYTHQAAFSGLAAGGVDSKEIKIDSDSDFTVVKLCYFADIAAAGQEDATRVIPLVNVLITDSASDAQLMRAPVPVPNIFGTGQIPFILPAPHVFRASGTISIAVTNFDAANTYNLTLSLIGFKQFLRG